MISELSDYDKFRECDEQFKQRQKSNYDGHHAEHPLPSIPDNTKVWITKDGRQTSGQIVSSAPQQL